MPLEFEFLSFDDIKKNGIPNDIGVLINAGVPHGMEWWIYWCWRTHRS
ncbi:lacto-N-biose phosphorylase central domain-containing protein [Evansella vedderi]